MMKYSLLIVSFLLAFEVVMANHSVEQTLSQFAWQKRQLIVFTPSEKHPQYKLFKKLEAKHIEDFKERKLHTWLVLANQKVSLDTNSLEQPSNQDFRNRFAVAIDDFRLILIAYDQQQKLSQSTLNMEALFTEIDQMPMRIQELQNLKIK